MKARLIAFALLLAASPAAADGPPTPEQALELLDRVVANVAGTRADHVKLVQAVGVIRDVIEPKQEETAPKAK